MPLRDLQQNLEYSSGKKFEFRLNDNRSTMLSVRWDPDCTKVSMHRMFLEAPKNIMDELACYLLRQKRQITPSIKAFIDTNLKKLDYSHHVDRKSLISEGNVYNLQTIYDDLNQEYFNQHLDLGITWFGKPNQKNRSRVTFGLYFNSLKLIKIHRMLDAPHCPEYVLNYIVFHEMLHHVCPSYVDEKGIHRIHSKAFKEKEEAFPDFHRAKQWIKSNHGHFFTKGY